MRRVFRAGGVPSLIGSVVDSVWTQAIRGLRDSQQYAVTAFEPTTGHDHGPTHVFLSAVRDADNGQQALGGLAIVFHAQREFATMVQELVGERSGCAAFVEASNQVVSASRTDLITPSMLDVPGRAGIVEHDRCRRWP